MAFLALSSLLGCRRPSDDTCRSVLAWVVAQGLPAGTHPGLPLPPDLAGATADGRVHAAVTPTRTCAVLKASIGWKENWKGTVICTAPIADAELRPWSGLRVLTLGDPPLEELFVSGRRSDRSLDVHFDLN